LLPRNARLPLGFSTLGCPAWTWPQILDFAAEHQFASIELRGILTNMDLTKVPELAPERIGDAKRQLAAHGLIVSDLGASAQMHDMDPVKHAAQLDEARRFIDLAHTLGAPYVRVRLKSGYVYTGFVGYFSPDLDQDSRELVLLPPLYAKKPDGELKVVPAEQRCLILRGSEIDMLTAQYRPGPTADAARA